jgi:hypothetical protein
MTTFQPKSLSVKKPDYQNDSFSSWLEKTLFTTIELGDLNNLNSDIKAVLVAAADAAQDQEKLNVVAAINETHAETRRILIRAIGMS